VCAECELRGVGKCKWIAQNRAMLNSLFFSLADIVLLTADANVSE
jgi:hypothetical protein